MAVIEAFFQSSGSFASYRDLLIVIVSGSLGLSAVSIKTIVWILSGPGDLDFNNYLSCFLTSATLMAISSRHLTYLRGVKACATNASLVNMLEK